jgi:hypothetical protein
MARSQLGMEALTLLEGEETEEDATVLEDV